MKTTIILFLFLTGCSYCPSGYVRVDDLCVGRFELKINKGVEI